MTGTCDPARREPQLSSHKTRQGPRVQGAERGPARRSLGSCHCHGICVLLPSSRLPPGDSGPGPQHPVTSTPSFRRQSPQTRSTGRRTPRPGHSLRGRTAPSSAQNPDCPQGHPGNGLRNTNAMLIPTHGPATLQGDSSKHTDEGATKFWMCLNRHRNPDPTRSSGSPHSSKG